MQPTTQPAARPSEPTIPAPLLPAPRFIDYFLIVTGVGISLVLGQMSGLTMDDAGTAQGMSRAFRAVLPQLLFLPMGVVLFWPVFFAVQRMFGRELGMTLGEWLWGVAWLGHLFFAIWFFWRGLGSMPTALLNLEQTIVIGYLLFLLSLGVIALLLAMSDVVRRTPLPWTHRFCLALLSWPLLPLAAMWLGKISFTA